MNVVIAIVILLLVLGAGKTKKRKRASDDLEWIDRLEELDAIFDDDLGGEKNGNQSTG